MSQFETLAAYEESDSDFEIEPPSKRRRTVLTWIQKLEFDSLDEAKSHIKSLREFVYINTQESERGMNLFYRCKESSTCKYKAKILLCDDSQRTKFFKTDIPHNHNAKAPHGLTDEQKTKIDEFFKNGTNTIPLMMRAFQNSGVTVPSKNQVKSRVSYLKKIAKPPVLSLGQLSEMIVALNDRPVNEDQAYIAQNQINYDEIFFSFFVTTPRLVALTKHSPAIQADATYKLMWENLPVLVVGTSDKNRNFHPFGMSVTTGETEADYRSIFQMLKDTCGFDYKPQILIADGAAAITNGFEAVFGTCTRVMCYFHVKKHVRDKLVGVNCPQKRDEVKRDIDLLQLADSEQEFEAASNLFIEKWNEDDDIRDFLQYFVNNYIKQRSGWYEGKAPGYPSTNNGLESLNNQIKKTGTFRNRLLLRDFVDCMFKTIESWSIERSPMTLGYKPFHTLRNFDLELQTKSYNWARDKSRKEVKSSQVDEDHNKYFIPASQDTRAITPRELASYLNVTARLSWKKYDSYRKCKERLWVVSYDENSWELSNCNCPEFKKKYCCKHVMGIAITKGHFKVLDAAKNIPIGTRRGAGRPKKARKALVITD